jgi:hypothetical protein
LYSSTIIVPGGVKDINDSAISYRSAGVRHVWEDCRNSARPGDPRLAINGQFKLPFKEIENLLVGMRMLG